MVDPIEILLELGFDLDDISTDEGYLSALKEAIATIEFKTGGSGDERSSTLREEVKKVRNRKKNKARSFVSPKFLKGSSNSIPVRSIVSRDSEVESEEPQKKPMDFMAFLTNVVAPSLTRIEASLENIIGLMSQDQRQNKKSKEKTRISADKKKKQDREEKNENVSKAFNGVKDRVMAPVKSMFDRVIEFFTQIGIGILAIQALKILKDPAGYFGPILNPIIDFLNGTIKFVWNIINPIYGLVNILNSAIRTLETVVNNTIGKIPGVPELDLPEISGIAEPPQIPRIETPKEEEPANVQGMAEGGIVNNYTTIQNMSEGGPVTESTGEKITGMGADTQMVALEPGEVVMSRKAVDEYGADTLLGMNAAAGGTNRPTMGRIQGFKGGGMVGDNVKKKDKKSFNIFNPMTWFSGDVQKATKGELEEVSNDTLAGRLYNRRKKQEEMMKKLRGYDGGGRVTGEFGIDKVPAMLTNGEFVMSTGAVQKYGLDTMMSMNASGGGTNKPSMDPVRRFQGGGLVGNNMSQYSTEQLKGMLDPTMMGKKNPAVFQAARNARELAKQQGLNSQQTERLVLEATIRASGSSSPTQHRGGQRSKPKRKPEPQQKMVPGSGKPESKSKEEKQRGYGTPQQRKLLDAISFAEGTTGSYGTLYGGKVIPELERGEMTVAEVLKMQESKMYKGEKVYGSGYNSNATGKYQFMSYVLREEMQKQNKSLDEKFTPELQDELILNRMSRMRGVTPELLAKEGISDNVIDKLAPEFASFPNLIGPDAQGRVGTNSSYYGQGGKSASAIKKAYTESEGEGSGQPQQSSTLFPSGPQIGLQPSDMPLDASAPGFGMVSPPELKPITMNTPPRPPSRGGGGKGGMSVLPIPSGGGKSGGSGSTGGGSAPSGFSPIDQSNPERLVVKAIYNIVG